MAENHAQTPSVEGNDVPPEPSDAAPATASDTVLPHGDDHRSVATASVISVSTFGLAKNVSSFLEKLEPWKAIMPTALLEEMEEIQKEAKDYTSKDVESVTSDESAER